MTTPDFPVTPATGSTLQRPCLPTLAHAPNAPTRLSSQQLFQHGRAVEIMHEGRVYELRLTRLNKLILTA